MALFFLASGTAWGQEGQYENEPVYDCTAEETKVYIEQVTYPIFAPSNIPAPEEFKLAYIETKEEAAAQGDGEASSCATIFSDGQLAEDWKEMLEALRSIDFDVDFTSVNGAMIKELLAKARDKAKQALADGLAKLGGDICALLATDNIKEILLDNVNDKYGMNARNLRLKDFASEISDEMISNSDDNIQMLLDERKLKREVRNETRGEIRGIRKDLWNNI
jgi:hypothetical protein